MKLLDHSDCDYLKKQQETKKDETKTVPTKLARYMAPAIPHALASSLILPSSAINVMYRFFDFILVICT